MLSASFRVERLVAVVQIGVVVNVLHPALRHLHHDLLRLWVCGYLGALIVPLDKLRRALLPLPASVNRKTDFAQAGADCDRENNPQEVVEAFAAAFKCFVVVAIVGAALAISGVLLAVVVTIERALRGFTVSHYKFDYKNYQ